MVYFIGIVVVIVIAYIITKKKEQNRNNTKQSKATASKNNYTLLDSSDSFQNVLDNTLKFVDAYLAESPARWVNLIIAPVEEKAEFSTDSFEYYTEFIEFEVTLDIWYDSILYKNEEIKDYMESLFDFNPKEKVFSYKMLNGKSTNCMIPHDIILKNLFNYLDTYEKTNPNRKLTRTSFGVHHVWEK